MIKENWNRMDWLQKLPDFSLPEVSDICKSHIVKTVQHIAKKSLWALKMLDSSSKIPASVLEGNVFNFGNYDECLDVDVKEKWGSFIGQHCMANIQIPLATGTISGMNATTFPLYWSACIPSTCSAKEFENMLKVVVPLNISVPEYLCHHRNQQRPYQAEDWIAIAILVILALLSIAGTIHTLLVKDLDRQFKGLAIFSWYQNGKSLLSTKTSPDSLAALHGIRVISIFLVVYGHSYEYTGISPQMNFLRAEEDARRWKNLMIYSGLFAVDTFFLISGLLLCYIFMKTLDKGFRFNAPTFYFHRFLRVTPALAILVLLQTSLIPRLSNGPIWDVVMTNILQKECVKHWWSTLLFVQNYTNPKELCIGVSWFLCVDMQMYWISPVFLLALHKKPKLGIGLLIATMIGGIIIAFQQAYVYGDNNSIISERGVAVDRYYQTHTRFVPWIVGLACGYLLHRTTEWRNRVAVGTEHLSKKIVISGWTISIICCAGTLAAIHPFQQKDYVYNAIEASLFASLSHAIWALSVAWIIFACVSGYGGFVNTILSWPALLPLSRLTFSLYLIHLVFISVFLAMYKAPGYMQEMEMLLIFLGYLVGSLLLSVVMTLLVESPIIGLEKILFKRAKTSAEYRRSFEDEELQKIKRSTENTKYL